MTKKTKKKNKSKKSGKSQIKKTGKWILAKAMEKHGVKYVFGYTGGAIMPMYDELVRSSKVKPVKVRNEQGAAFAAQGYARATGKIGFVFTTSGPGATNTITGVADAMMDSTPIMVITGQVPTTVVGTDAFQESDMVGMMYPITKQAIMVTKADDVAQTFFELTEIALQGRPGPVHLDFPKDVQMTGSTNVDYKSVDTTDYYPTAKVGQAKYDRAIKMINKADRPIVFCGHGVILANAGKEFKHFVEKANAPFACTMQGISAVPADHYLNLGMMGMHGTVAANRAIFNSDLIVSFGMRFDDRVTGKLAQYANHAKIIHVEIDPSEIDKNVGSHLAINADVKQALKKMNNKKIKKKKRKEWFKQIKQNQDSWQQYFSEKVEKGVGPNKGLLMSSIMTELSKVTKGQDNIVADVGIHEMMAARFYNFQRFNSWFGSGGLGTMGFSLPTAVGVKFARPQERVWAIMGDGSFQMNLQELGTVMEHKLDLKILVMNNSVLGMVRQWQDLFFDKRFVETDMVNPDFIKLAEAYGIQAKSVKKVEDVKKVLEWSIETPGPTLVEFKVDKDEKILPMVPSGATFDQMIERLD